MKSILLLFTAFCITKHAQAQYFLSGIVYDSSLQYGVQNVKVINEAGDYAYSDSVGRYKIAVTDKDSVYFTFLGKPTPKFAINKVQDISQFDVRLHINYRGKYKLLKEVVVYSKSFQEKTLENRETYAKVFNYEKPGLHTSMSNGVAGADLNALINIFRFRHNKMMHWFKNKLEAEEEEKYINYRFNKHTVKRITQLDDKLIDSFMVAYRPNYEFASTADEMAFNQYVLNCYYLYKMDMLKPSK